MKKHLSTVILVLMLVLGFCLLLYPTFSDYVNSLLQSRAIASYNESVKDLDSADYEKILNDAKQYNAELAQKPQKYDLSEAEKVRYEQLLRIVETGMMGYIEIPSIKVSLPIYHGTGDEVLNTAISHLEWTSLPVGGASSHCVLTGHRGLPNAMLFTNLDSLKEGDTFVLRVLNEVLTDEVDQILIVEPNDTEALQIVEGKDYCTLVTCTPYGVNTHRLLVRGHRTENADGTLASVAADAMRINPILVALAIALPLLVILVIVILLPRRNILNKH